MFEPNNNTDATLVTTALPGCWFVLAIWKKKATKKNQKFKWRKMELIHFSEH